MSRTGESYEAEVKQLTTNDTKVHEGNMREAFVQLRVLRGSGISQQAS
jgi:hypothetical protein